MSEVWSSWAHVGWVALLGALIYLWILLSLQINGLRTFTSFSGYDFVMTVAVGSIVASVVLSSSVALVDGLVAIASLVLVQRLITEARRSHRVERTVDNKPLLLVAHGTVLHDNTTRSGVTMDDVRDADLLR